MKIATYNIWNDKRGFDIRLKLLVEELNRYNIDILALQEVKDESIFKRIKEETNFEHGYYFDGLVFLSNYDIKVHKSYSKDNNYMFRVVYKDISITNVHFDWENESNRQKGLEDYFDLLDEYSLDTEIILGDFNSSPESKLHFELILTDFHDIHKEYAHSINQVPLPTLDIKKNPRWRNTDTNEEPERFDWIMVNSLNEFKIEGVQLIGVEETNGLAPSDHYGVLSDFEFKE